jgi:cyclic pyranopterin phosphate synthase
MSPRFPDRPMLPLRKGRYERLTHIGPDGQARMVDVGDKPSTAREAVARGRAGALEKGDAVQTARLAGIMAAKSTSTLIPLCHPLPLAGVDVTIVPVRDGYAIESRVRTVAQTGVEMEALTAVSVAALTLYDMVKAVDRTMTITDVELVSKRGGQSGDYQRSSAAARPRVSAAANTRRPRAGAAARPAPRIADRTLEGRPAAARESAAANKERGRG